MYKFQACANSRVSTSGRVCGSGPVCTATAWPQNRNQTYCQRSENRAYPRNANMWGRSRSALQRGLQQISKQASAEGGNLVQPEGGVESLKKQLFLLVTELNSCAPGDPKQRALSSDLLRMADSMAALNPTPDAAQSPLINGRWALVYTAKSAQDQSSSSSSQADPLQSGIALLYNFFYSNFPLLAGSAVGSAGSSSWLKVRGNFQVFDTSQGLVDNEVRFTVLGKPGRISVRGSACVVQPSNSEAPVDRLKAVFEDFKIEWDGTVRLQAPLSLLNPTGYVDTKYLDQEMRISYGDKGSIFIARRADNSV